MNKSITVSAIAVVITVAAIVGGIGLSKLRDTNSAEHSNKTNTSHVEQDSNSAKTELEKRFETYTGEQYEKLFLADMIPHHQGAIDMANLALTNAKHQEIKDLATNIIASQTKELGDMTTWQVAWGFVASSTSQPSPHSETDNTAHQETDVQQLTGKADDEFDETFLKLMIEHHGSAVSMSRPAAKNANRQEIKDLAKAIIETQDAEIAQMRALQIKWNYEQ